MAAIVMTSSSAFAGDIATERTQATTMGIITWLNTATQEIQGIVAEIEGFEETAGELLRDAAHDLLPIEDIFELMAEAERILETGNQMAYSADGLEDFMQEKFKTYGDYLQAIRDDGGIIRESFENRFKEWNSNHRTAIRQIMASHNFHADQIETSQARLETLQELSRTATGRMQAAQVGHKVAIEQVKQIHELRSIIMEQSNLHASFFAHKQAMEAEQSAATEYLVERREGHGVVDTDNGEVFGAGF